MAAKDDTSEPLDAAPDAWSEVLVFITADEEPIEEDDDDDKSRGDKEVEDRDDAVAAATVKGGGGAITPVSEIRSSEPKMKFKNNVLGQ